MGYIESNLMPDEKVLYTAKLHWIVFIWPIIWLLFAIILFADPETAAGGSVFVFIAIIMGIAAFINYSTSEFGLTDKRVLVKVGLIRRKSMEILLTKVESIQVNQGLIGRIFGYGSVVISGSGGSKNPFSKIAVPLEFRNRVNQQIASI